MALQSLSGMNPTGILPDYAASGVDVNQNGRVGLEEALYALQFVSGLRTGIPPAPADVAAQKGDGQVTVTWSAVAGASSYNLYWATAASVTPATATKIAGAVSPYLHTGLTNGTAYYYVVTAVISGVEGGASAEVQATPLDASTDIGNSVNSSSLVWNTGASAGWFGQTGTSHDGDGTGAVQTGAITDNQSTWFSTTVNGSGTLSFWWKVDSQAGSDYLTFYIDGVEQPGRISGSVDWTQATGITIPTGSHVLKWEYRKDSSGSSGADAGWVDQVVFAASEAPAGMVSIPGGSFQMGGISGEGEDDEFPTHTVTVSAFYLDQYEVTKALWDEVYTWATAHGYDFDNSGTAPAASRPIEHLSWYDTLKWLNARSEKEGRTSVYHTDSAKTTVYRTGQVDVTNAMVKWTANGYRLPTEAEWEYAARAGTTTRFYTGNCISADTDANYDGGTAWSGCSYGQSRSGTTEVGTFPANPWGLFDMAGNVMEWAWDWYGSSYTSGAAADPRGPVTGSSRVIRGGAWYYGVIFVRSAGRFSTEPINAYDGVGFRSAVSQAPSLSTHSVTGTVTAGGSPLSGVSMALTGGVTATTGPDGTYAFPGLENGSYTLTPSKAGYTFNPASREVAVSGANVPAQDFAATLVPAPANVTAQRGDGQVTVTWSAVAGASSYNLYWATAASVTPATATKIAGAVSPYLHTGLTNGTAYHYVVTAVVSGVEGGASAEVQATPLDASTDIGNSVNSSSLVWTTGGNAGWFGQTGTSHDSDGTGAVQTGAITDNQSTWFSTTVNGPGTLSFWWKVDSQAGSDYLRFYIDGVEQPGKISGSVDWVQATGIAIPAGSHVLKWEYSKDSSGSSGADAGWVDQVVFAASDAPAGMVPIPAGSFQMGGVEGEGNADELPAHTVTVSAFYLDQYEVTKALWDEVLTWAMANGYGFEHGFDNAGIGTADNHPVNRVSWCDMIKWLNARSEKEGRTPVYHTDLAKTTVYRTGQANVTSAMVKWTADGYRLPTEAEWEYAYRAGTTTRFYTGDCISADTEANYYGRFPWPGCPAGQSRGVTTAVGTFPANPWGLYDMAGNASEWVWDWYNSSYASGAVTDPRGPDTGLGRVARGGYSYNNASSLRSASRGGYGADMTAMYLGMGFRSALSQPQSTYSITGTVTADGSPLSGISLALTGGTTPQTATTGPDGTYAFPGLESGSYTLTPSKAGYTFNPASREVAVSGADVPAQDFAATPAGMVSIPGGSFQMGSVSEGYDGEHPAHTVTVSAFYLDQYEVTKALWDEVLTWATAHGYVFEHGFDNAGTGTANNHPAQSVSWCDTLKWLNARSEKEGRIPVYHTDSAQTTVYRTGQVDVTNAMVKWTANGYRLPTEAEWEYAARAGTITRFYTGNCISADTEANYRGSSPWPDDCPSGQSRAGTTEVGTFPANPWGLFDMAGNVQELVWDRYGAYASDAVTNPRGPDAGPGRVVRGGAWSYVGFDLRSTSRGAYVSDMTAMAWVTGFRSAVSQP